MPNHPISSASAIPLDYKQSASECNSVRASNVHVSAESCSKTYYKSILSPINNINESNK